MKTGPLLVAFLARLGFLSSSSLEMVVMVTVASSLEAQINYRPKTRLREGQEDDLWAGSEAHGGAPGSCAVGGADLERAE